MYSLTQLEDKGIDQIYMKREALVLARSRYIMVWKNPTIILHLTSPRPLLISTAQTQHQQFAYQPFAYIFIHHPNPFFIDVNQFHFWNVAGKAPKSNKNSSFCTLRNFALRFGIEYNWSLEYLTSIWVFDFHMKKDVFWTITRTWRFLKGITMKTMPIDVNYSLTDIYTLHFIWN